MESKNFGYVLATKKLIEQKLPVGFMYHEKGEGQDSGWRFFVGDEPQEYVDDPSNIAIYDIKTILKIDKSVKPLLDAEIGSAFEREEGKKTFVKVDFDFGKQK